MKKRLDVFLSELKGISRTSAKTLILDGKVSVDGKNINKPSLLICENNIIDIIMDMKYVSRGGYKLEKALNVFSINLCGKVCMDIGASSGGFTDCMIQNNAEKVYAVDVGHGQLSEKLKKDSRVISIEKTNIRDSDLNSIVTESMDFIAIDVSFISLTKIFKPAYRFMKDTANAVCLIKPQFETGQRRFLNKRGILKDISLHKEILKNVTEQAVSSGYNICGLIESPIKGGSGNIEYLLHIRKETAFK